MPACKEKIRDEAYAELQIINAKAVKCLEKAVAHLRSANPFLKALENDGGIGDLDGFINVERVGSEC